MKPRCKARSRRGERCKRVGNSVCQRCGVCRHHGCNCANPGGRPPVHGLYSAHVDAELAALIEGSSGDVELEQEIRLLRALVKRALQKATKNPALWDQAGFNKALSIRLAEIRKAAKTKAQIDARARESEALEDAEIPWTQPLPAGLEEGLEEAAAYLESVRGIEHLEPSGGSVAGEGPE